jgi:hypothetical protein
LVRPFTVIGLAFPEAACPPLDVTVYEVMGLPPFEAGAVKLTFAWALPGVTLTTVGGPGTPAGVTLLEGVEAGPGPTALTAVTVNL